jgi:hypothetical protein
VNNPKKESMLKKVTTMIKHQISGGPSPYFKQLSERDIEESTIIPTVKAQKDFKDYKKKIAVAAVADYFENHTL